MVIFDHQKLTPEELDIIDLMGNHEWIISEFFTSCELFVSESQFRRFVKNRPELFGMSEALVWSLVDLRPLAEKIHDILNESSWKIWDLMIWLQTKNINFKSVESLLKFLERRPEAFVLSDNHVWPMTIQKSIEKTQKIMNNLSEKANGNQVIKKKLEENCLDSSENCHKKLSAHEQNVLDLMLEKSSWAISEFRNRLLEEGKLFQSETEYLRFLKKRPKLFGISETHVWSLVKRVPLVKQIQDVLNESSLEIQDLFKLLQEKNIGDFKSEESLRRV